MTMLEFDIACGDRCLHPAMALEEDFIMEALKSGDDDLVLTLLDSEF